MPHLRRTGQPVKTSWNRSGTTDSSAPPSGSSLGFRTSPIASGGKLLLKVGDRLSLVRSEAGDVDQPGYLLRAAGDGDHRAAVGMADEHHGPVELVDQSL